jgi:hypothetical protein
MAPPKEPSLVGSNEPVFLAQKLSNQRKARLILRSAFFL